MSVVVYNMAAQSNDRCPFHRNLFIVIITFLCWGTVPVATQTTADAGSTTPVVTTIPTTPSTTPAGSTPIAPQGTPSPIPANTDIGDCSCDLTGNACDVNCCCDSDCSSVDRLAFSGCLPYSVSYDDRLCLQADLVFRENTPYVSNVTSDNLFCIYVDNRAERNFYTNPDLVNTQEVFNRYVQENSRFSFRAGVTNLRTNYSDFYKTGDVIYTVFPSQAQGTFGLPTALSSNLCTDANPAAYLQDQSTSCVRETFSIASTCESNPALSADTYYNGFQVVTSPALFQRYTPSNDTNTTDPVDPTVITDVYNNTYTIPIEVGEVFCETQGVVAPCNLTTPLTPVWNATSRQCEYVVTRVAYTITSNGTGGITSVSATFTLSSLPLTRISVTQYFSTVFRGLNEPANPFQRSGNPGYVEGAPVMAGVLRATTVDGITTDIVLRGDSNQWLTTVRASAQGDCVTDASQSRVSVKFKEDMRSGCIIRISQSNVSNFCQMIQQTIVSALEGDLAPVYDPATGTYPPTNRYVATFGNADVKKVGDWTPILIQNRPATSGVLYAYVGALTNPQAKIIGVSFLYDAPQSVDLMCEGLYCQSGATGSARPVEVSSSVSFIDVSESAVGYEAERPIFIAKVPYDFFYPFLDSASHRIQSSRINALAVLLLCSLNMLRS